jgi:hypothetical protein
MKPSHTDFLQTTFLDLLATLPADRAPVWGLMTAQHMVEHLGTTFLISNGRIKVPAAPTLEKFMKEEGYKKAFFANHAPFPRNLRAPLMPEAPQPYRFANIEEAKKVVIKEMNRYFQFFAENPAATPYHPRFNYLNFEGWNEFHVRHIVHHFTQFGLINDN